MQPGVQSLEIVKVAKSLSDLQDSSTSSRHEKSLGLLTTKFVTLLQEAKDGVLDLKVAADQLAVRQKRRIYDITNVLEGIGLIEKKSKNSIQWKGSGPGNNSRDISERLVNLKDDLANLRERELELDKHKQWVQQSIKNVTDEVSNTRLAYVTVEDMCHCFKGETLLALRAPSGTQLEVPIPEIGPGYKKNYQINLKSQNGPINALLVNKDSDESEPVVVQVPPPMVLGGVTQTGSSEALQNQNQEAGKQVDKGGTVTRGKFQRSPTKNPLKPTQPVEPPTRMVTRSSPRKNVTETLFSQPSTSSSTLSQGQGLDFFTSDIFDTKTDIDSGGELWDLDQIMSADSTLTPLLPLSPPPSGQDYYFNLDDTEGAFDLFDVDMDTMLSS